MYLSLEWLRQYVDLGEVDPKETALKLTMATAEVEGVETLTRSVKGVVVAEIKSAEPVETGDPDKKITYVTVDYGGGTIESVCGAPNVEVGMKTAFAPSGTVLSGGVTVKEQDVYGKKSRGVLCSPMELGWGDSHVGIMAFPSSLAVGTELSELVPKTDYIIEIDNKSITHRPDLWGHYGFARELAAIYGKELKPLDCADASAWAKLDKFPLKIEDYESCPGYSCLDIDNLVPAYSPVPIQYRLLSIGQRPINLLVDLTNYIMLELGQPMHAFDGERVRDIIVTPFGTNGTFRTLDSVERQMLPEDLMINDHNGPVALAGVMGGEESEIKEDTSRVLLESANFNPSRIRRTALRLNLRTDASLRFEKGQPPYHMGESIKRFVRLLEEAGQEPIVRSSLTSDGDTGETPRTLVMKQGYINHTIGMEIPGEEIVGILESLDFGCEVRGDDLHLTIPRHRSVRDISIPNDIVEEVARVYGYDNVEPSMPTMKMTRYTFNEELQKQHKIRRLLSQTRGYTEVYTYSWYDNAWLKTIGYDPGETLELLNPSADINSRMRRNVMPNLLALVESNASYKDKYSMYEIGHVFHPTGPDSMRQAMNCAGIQYQSAKLGGIQDLFLSVKGAIEEICDIVNSPRPTFEMITDSDIPWSMLNASMDVIINGKSCGRVGYLTGKMFPVFDKDIQIAWFELEVDSVCGSRFPDLTYEPVPVYPGSWMDFSIVTDDTMSYEELSHILVRFDNQILKNSAFLYQYSGKGMEKGKISNTFRFWLGLKDRTLTGDDLNAFRDSFLAYLESNKLSLR